MFDPQGWTNRVTGSRRWSRAGAHLVVVALVAFSAAGGLMGARAQDLVADGQEEVEAAAFPFNLVALARAAEDSSEVLTPLILQFDDPAGYVAGIPRDGGLIGSLAAGDATAQTESAEAAASSSPEVEEVAPVVGGPVEPPPVVPQPAVPAEQLTSAMLGWPVAGGTISQGYWPGHLGVDIAAPWGTPVVSSASGTVTYAGWRDNGGGYVVEIAHDNGLVTVYNHLSSIWVWPGQYVGWGQGVGAIGCTGLCYGSHLHFAVFSGYVPVNPLRYL